MIEVLYCFDDNYNLQAFTSIYSLLENVSEKLNINIIHKTKKNHNFLPSEILDHKNLQNLKVFKFCNNDYKFPNIEGTHVSEATYYRIFLEDYLPQEIDNILYIDADIVCVNNPINSLKTEVENLNRLNTTIACKTEHYKQDFKDVFRRLNLRSDKYFNAGVMIINLKKWKSDNTKNNLLKILEVEYKKLDFWDQDLMNIYFDGSYLEISDKFNFVIDLAFYEYNNYSITTNEITNNNLFIHFAGSHKPWFLNGIICNLSELYQNYFRLLTKTNYHITHKMKRLTILYFIKSLFNFTFFKTKYPYALLKLLFLSFIEKK